MSLNWVVKCTKSTETSTHDIYCEYQIQFKRLQFKLELCVYLGWIVYEIVGWNANRNEIGTHNFDVDTSDTESKCQARKDFIDSTGWWNKMITIVVAKVQGKYFRWIYLKYILMLNWTTTFICICLFVRSFSLLTIVDKVKWKFNYKKCWTWNHNTKLIRYNDMLPCQNRCAWVHNEMCFRFQLGKLFSTRFPPTKFDKRVKKFCLENEKKKLFWICITCAMKCIVSVS